MNLPGRGDKDAGGEDPKTLDTDRTKVTVRTISSEVIDGKEIFNVHGGTANHYRTVPPVRQEEENVLMAILEELAKERPSGKTIVGQRSG